MLLRFSPSIRVPSVFLFSSLNISSVMAVNNNREIVFPRLTPLVVHKFGQRFIDSLHIYVRAGSGGHGLPKFGGIGGKGGDVCLESIQFQGLNSFLKAHPNKSVTADNGEDSKKNKIIGARGTDKVIKVPVGVIAYEADGKKIGELNEEGETLVVAKGGHGGSPDSKPPFNGARGEDKVIRLDLKLIADIGLVGFPNAGKSTLLKAISRAKPKIAAYPFTTLKPNLGVLEYEDFRQITMADLPGLIEGAAENIGMGHKFLRHVERTNLLLMVVDVEGFQYGPHLPHRSCLETIILLNKELELYDKALLKKPAILAVNKMDLPGSSEVLKELMLTLKQLKVYVKNNIPNNIRPETVIKFDKIVPISARYDRNSIEELKTTVRSVLDDVYFRKNKQMLMFKEQKLVQEFERLSSECNPNYL